MIEKVVSELSEHKGIAALVLVGSQVEGNEFPADEFSDIELYVVAYDKNYREVKEKVQNIQSIFDDRKVVLAYKNQWAGWSILFTDLLRLELPLIKTSDDEAFSRSKEQKIQILYQKTGFKLKRRKEGTEKADDQKEIEQAVKDFWYMAVYAAQHISRGEVWLARDAVRISMQGKVRRLLQGTYHKDTLRLDRDKRIELTWAQDELEILRKTSSTYDKDDLIRAFWANIKNIKALLEKIDVGIDEFRSYEQKLVPEIKKILD